MAIEVRRINGKIMDLEDLRPQDIQIDEIAHALSLTCRYGGRIKEFYSVAQHSVLVAKGLYNHSKNKNLALYGLLHDAAEAYLSDVVSPLKMRLDFYIELEDIIMYQILKKFRVRPGLQHFQLMKYWDKRLYRSEVDYFFGDLYLLVQPSLRRRF
jgi:5'-deoxynucleotidase YfbR-like HD superfamily hydrolase